MVDVSMYKSGINSKIMLMDQFFEECANEPKEMPSSLILKVLGTFLGLD
jgi:hypothetical protein